MTDGIQTSESEHESEHEHEHEEAPRPRRRWGLLLLALLAVGLGFGGTYLYLLVRHEPSAHLHVPAGSNVVVRMDAVALGSYPPVRRHLWPVLLRRAVGGAGKDKQQAGPTPLERIAAGSGVGIPADLRELVVATVDGKAWVAIAGGKLKPGRFVDAVEQVLKEDRVAGVTRRDDLLLHTSGAALGQAEDGALIAGTNVEVVRAALPVRDAGEELEIAPPLAGAVGFVIGPTACAALVSRLDLRLPGVDTLAKIRQVSGVVTLGDAPALALSVGPRDTDPAELARRLDRLRGSSRLLGALLPVAGAWLEPLGAAVVEPRGDHVLVTIPLPAARLEALVAGLARRLEEAT